MMQYKNILITGGYGFIGSNFIRYLFNRSDFDGVVVNVDKLTYAANPNNLVDIAKEFPDRYFFEKIDICDTEKIDEIFARYGIDCLIHFAAESHVDRSILAPSDFIRTNIFGTFSLLEVARKYFEKGSFRRFHHISTDEVYGSLDSSGYFYETTPYAPRSPYSASKAGSDHLVRSYFNTYNLPVTISICSNNYGPYQFPEKLIPFMIENMIAGKELPIYGDGRNVRDWIYVEDHCSAIWKILENGKIGETYNIGGENEWENIELVRFLSSIVAQKIGKSESDLLNLLRFVKDRPGHDRRYAINCDKIKNELGWRRNVDFPFGLELTVDWYLANREWVEQVKSGEYLNWLQINYQKRK